MSHNVLAQRGDVVYQNGRIATMDANHPNQYGLILNHDLIIRGNKILAIQPSTQLPNQSLNTDDNKFNNHIYDYSELDDNEITIVDLKNALITPGLIDCHTHLVFGGNRATEWEMRLKGTSYVDIAANGGGINSTVQATRNASFNDLYILSEKRLMALIKEGITTIEAKSGYGLNLVHERKQLQVSQKLARNLPIEIANTLLSAHTIPPEFKGRSDDYIQEICTHIMPTLWKENLFEAVDVFCESVGFNLAQTKALFDAAIGLGIPVKGHVEQLSNLGGSELVAQYNGLSVDHIEHLDEPGILALKNSRTVATLLPLAYYFLKETKRPPIELLRQYHIPIAISTDFNPGTAPIASLRLAMNMACTYFGLTPEEVLQGVTKHAAMALGREKTHGQLRAGFIANFCVWDVEHPVEIFYELGHNPLKMRVFEGKISHNYL